MLIKQNSGVFPVGRRYDTIDGRNEVTSHGTRDMPVFGYRFWPPPTPGFFPKRHTMLTRSMIANQS
jgi:hypothetical protein